MLKSIKERFSWNKKQETPVKKQPDINEGKIKTLIRTHCANHKINWKNWELHLIESSTSEDKIDVYITCGNPGIVIGYHGIVVDKLASYLGTILNKPVKIHIKEFNVWL